MKIILTIVGLILSVSVHAKCKDYPESIEAFYQGAETVIFAEILSAEINESTEHSYRTNFKILESYKGKLRETGVAEYSDEVHSILVTPGLKYILFFNEGSNYISICSGSHQFDGSMKSIRKLRDLSGKGV